MVGAILLGSREPGLGRPELRQLLELIGGQIGTAISYSAANERLRASEERARILTEEASDGIYTLDAAGNLDYVNPHFERLLGYCREELIGRDFMAIVPERSLPRVGAPLAQEGGTSPPLHELEVRRKDGAIVTLEISSRSLYDHRTCLLYTSPSPRDS